MSIDVFYQWAGTIAVPTSPARPTPITQFLGLVVSRNRGSSPAAESGTFSPSMIGPDRRLPACLAYNPNLHPNPIRIWSPPETVKQSGRERSLTLVTTSTPMSNTHTPTHTYHPSLPRWATRIGYFREAPNTQHHTTNRQTPKTIMMSLDENRHTTERKA